MRKHYLLIVAVLLTAVLAMGCSQGVNDVLAQNEPAPAETPAPTLIPTEEPTPSPTPSPTPTPVPVVRSYTSGIKAEDQSTPAKYLPVIVSVENSIGARPQVGLNAADIIYEFAVETAITRFQLVFNDNPPLFAGPVRSSRIYLMRFQQEWQAIYAHEGYGGPRYDGSWIAMHATRSNKYVKKSFWRTKEKGKKSEHTMMVNTQALADIMYGGNDYRPTPAPDRFHWLEGIKYNEGKDFSKVTLNFFYRTNNEDEKITFIYDPATNLLSRKQDGYTFGTRMPSTASGTTPKTMNFIKEDLSVQNLIVQYCDYSMIEGDRKGRRDCELTGTGKCDYFINGQHVTGTWSRPSYEETTTYLLDNGDVVMLEPGRTWVAVHPNNAEESPVNITYRDGTSTMPTPEPTATPAADDAAAETTEGALAETPEPTDEPDVG